MNTLYPYTSDHYPLRITRSTFLIRSMCFLVGTLVAGAFMSSSSILLSIVGALLLLFLFVGLFRWILIPRLHDMGLEPAWAWSLLFFVHSVNFLFLLALLLIPTDAFAKRRYIV